MAEAASESEHASKTERNEDSPDNPTDIPKDSWPTILKRTFKQFGEDQLTTWAAALTYFGVLSLFPMLLALVSVLGVIGPSATEPLLDNLGTIAPGPARDILENVLTSLESNQGGSTIALIIGLLAAIWSASGYIGAFMDASNNVWDAPEGRPIWKKIPVRLAVTVVLLILLTATALAVVFTGPIAEKAGDIIGLGSTFVECLVDRQVADPADRRVLHGLAALLGVPERQAAGLPLGHARRVFAVVLWIIASALFALYVANFSSYNKTYGSLGGVIVFLTWLWITNIIILLGAELNAEMERSKAIQEGHPPDKEPYLPLRDEPEED